MTFKKDNNTFCMENPQTTEISCFPDFGPNAATYYGAWCSSITVLGTCGNLMTLIAIPLASKRKRFECP